MKNKLVFATNNKHKLEEVSHILKDKIEILSLKDINCDVDIPETANTLEGNALLKAQYIHENYGLNCFADDTGLEIEALNNEPGVYSARYAGTDKSSEANMLKVLKNLEGIGNRKAQFRTAVSLIIDNKQYLFEGIIKGNIIKEKRGNSGFGYDPIFVPEGYEQTFAELGNEIKNKISHRALAINKLCNFLNEYDYEKAVL
ncbi:non-canonical purine NTP diphosphatase [uncultured Bacteroides sp.]|uniref:non-canonical purine NTP diphosphatase n=1 Tax=uncultured Bacteroides sp. TaxID=162156 RepID=UPI002AAA87D3|nr:non-canonical purine NTP diphosphatase [uncultured Bacteroides sp.]